MLTPELLESVLPRAPLGLGGHWHGVHTAIVNDIVDPEGLGRVQICLPWVPDAQSGVFHAWARVATLMAGQGRGSWFIPDKGDEVLVAFECGDPRRPFVLGGLWNGRDKPPLSMDSAARNNLKVIRSRKGVKVTLDDSDGKEKLLLETPGGQKVWLKDGPASIEISDASGNSVKLESTGITLRSSSMVTVEATSVKVSASLVKVDAGTTKFCGTVIADSVICNGIVSCSYTPGAGNIW